MVSESRCWKGWEGAGAFLQRPGLDAPPGTEIQLWAAASALAAPAGSEKWFWL